MTQVLPAKDKPGIDEFPLIEMTPSNALVTADDRPIAPQARSRWGRGLFILVFVLPTLLTGLYLFGFATDQYMSESQIMVRTPSTAGGLNSIVGQTIGRSNDETQAVATFMRSRDMVERLAQSHELKSIFNRPEADAISRFPNFYTADNFERFVDHFRARTSAEVNDATGIVTIRVTSYRAQDSLSINEAMLKHAEGLVNSLNTRAYEDRVAYARRIVERARDEVSKAEAAMTEYRNQNQTVDPARESAAGLEAVGKMTTELAQLEATLKQQMALTPGNPGTPTLQKRIATYKEEIDRLRRKVVGEAGSISTRMGGFERLVLQRQLVARGLESAISNLDKARLEAETPHVYLVRLAEPNLADVAEYPRRVLWLALIAALSFACWVIVRFAIRSILEHRA